MRFRSRIGTRAQVMQKILCTIAVDILMAHVQNPIAIQIFMDQIINAVTLPYESGPGMRG